MDPTPTFKDLKIEDEPAHPCRNSPHPIKELHSALLRRLGSGDSAAELIRGAAPCCLFPASCPDLRTPYAELVRAVTQHAVLPACHADNGSLPATSYEGIPVRARAVAETLLALSCRFGDSSAPRCPVRAVAPDLCIFAVTHLQEGPWSDEESRRCASELLDSTVTLMSSGSVLEMLCGNHEGERGGLLGPVLDTLQPELTKEKWKQNQALKHVFSWLLLKVERPWLADYLEKVLPPSLLVSDDYQTENKVLGVQCLHHIVLNVPAADLRQFNRAQVMYHALFNHLYTSEAPLIQVVLPCLIDLMSVLEKPLVHTGQPRKPNRFDDVFRLILTHMEMEHKLLLRRVYASSLLLFIEKMGIGIARHLKRLERVIVGYLEVSDGPEETARLTILEVLERTIQTAWPRMECRMGVLAKSLLRFLVDVSIELLAPDLREALMSRASHCLLLLDHCTQGKLLVTLKDVDSSCVSDSVLKCIQDLKAQQGVSAVV